MRPLGIISLPDLREELARRGVSVHVSMIARHGDAMGVPYARIGRNRAYRTKDISKIKTLLTRWLEQGRTKRVNRSSAITG